MNLGIALPILANIDVKDQLKIAIRAEELGFKSVWASDHIVIPEGTFAVLFGKNSFLQNLTALFSIISTYTIISDRIGN